MTYHFFLGGQDLEMVTIRDLLNEVGQPFCDKGLQWGARASDYRSEIEHALAQGETPVLVELQPDLALPPGHRVIVDHHGEHAGADRPSSLRQVFELLKLPAPRWTRGLALVEANDIGHVRGMLALGASLEELTQIRRADRAAQGITELEEAAAREAIAARFESPDGSLMVVRIPHTRASAVADLMDEALGGPGFRNLLVVSPTEVNLYGEGWLVSLLHELLPGGWLGGALPERGFFGHRREPRA